MPDCFSDRLSAQKLQQFSGGCAPGALPLLARRRSVAERRRNGARFENMFRLSPRHFSPAGSITDVRAAARDQLNKSLRAIIL